MSLCKEIQQEIKSVCSDTYDSILRMTSKPALENFTWERVWQELLLKTPLLTTVLNGLLPPAKKANSRVVPALCVCASILLKLQNQKVNVVQALFLKEDMPLSRWASSEAPGLYYNVYTLHRCSTACKGYSSA